jgi:hypothetical protein
MALAIRLFVLRGNSLSPLSFQAGPLPERGYGCAHRGLLQRADDVWGVHGRAVHQG